ncbi:MAG: Lrp/AsnC family transcriptional regulator [Candidatus Bathyarchaeota archaeon]
MQVDRLDLGILRSLSRDGRKPYKTIARELDVSDATVRKRVKRMQRDGIIKQFNVLIHYDRVGSFIKAFIGVKINPSKLQSIVTGLDNNQDVQVMYRTTGTHDILVEVILKDMKELNWFLEKRLNLDGILETEVNVVIESYKRCPCTNI